ncbi:MAG TPA: 2-hydroxychromene-2-carboxylate isomerase [Arenicellales bacterium]|nr:2-hydroxychromene-2-carboxylate isomerase [Arenicellales bacterium]
MKVEWYFDYVSPYSYLQWAHQLAELEGLDIELRPVLFAGLLKHWGQKGPAEVSAKRRFTYRHVVWLADRFDVPFRLPSAHPFNPLPLLRAGIALGNSREVVDRLFGFVWRAGNIPTEEAPWRRLMEELDLSDQALSEPSVKQQLLDNGERAIGSGVFGVPSLVADGEVFWGVDGFEFFQDYLADPGLFAGAGMRAADSVPSGV